MAGRARREWGSGSIYPVKGGLYWRVSVPIPSALGRRRQEWQYRTEEAARRQLEAVQRRLARGLPAEEGRVTVAEYAQDWLAQLQVKPSTASMYGSIVRHQLGHVGAMRLTRVSPPDIRDLLREREREGYSGRTRRAVLDVLRMIFRMAEGDQLVSGNPAELVKAPRIDAKEPVHLTAEQARRFLDAAKDDALSSLYAVALGTGLRRGELLALTWRDVDSDSGTVAVRSGKTRAAARTVPLPGFARLALAGLTKRPGPIWPYSPSYVTRHVGVICARAGVPRMTFHQLRHTAASLMLEQGVDSLTIRGILGHTRLSTTAGYARPDDALRRDAVERLGRAVNG
jgi:integrase